MLHNYLMFTATMWGRHCAHFTERTLSFKEHIMKPKSNRAVIQTQVYLVPTLKWLTRKPPIFFHFFFLPGTISVGFVGYKQWYLPSRKSIAAQPFFPTWHWDTEYLILATLFLKPWRPPWVLWHRIKLILWTLTSSATALNISPLLSLWWEQLARASPRRWQTCWASSTSPRYTRLLRWGSRVSRDQDSKGCHAHCPYSSLFSYLSFTLA